MSELSLWQADVVRRHAERYTIHADLSPGSRAELAGVLAPFRPALRELDSPAVQARLAWAIAAAQPALQALADRVHEAVTSGLRFCVVRGMDAHQLDDRDAYLFAVGMSALVGTPSCGSQGNVVAWPVTPIAEQDGEAARQNVSVTMDEAVLHTDSSFMDTPEAMFCLWCIRPAACGGGRSVLIDARQVVAELAHTAEGRDAIARLEATRVPFFGGQDRLHWANVLGDSEVFVRYRPDLIEQGLAHANQAIDGGVRGALATFAASLGQPHLQARIALAAGDVLFVNNHELIHGRDAFEDPQRFLLRVRMNRGSVLARPPSAAQMRAVIPQYDALAPVSAFSVDNGFVRAARVAPWAVMVAIGVGSDEQQVVVRAPGFTRGRIIDMRAQQKLRWNDGSVTVDVPDDGVVWLLVYEPPTDVSVYDYAPASNLRPRATRIQKARFPVVDVHAHLLTNDVDATSHIELMDALDIAVVVDSSFSVRNETSQQSAARFQQRFPDRFCTFAPLDLTGCATRADITAVCDQLLDQQRNLGIVGIGELHEKGAGLRAQPMFGDDDPLFVDDPRLDPLWETLAGAGLPVLLHLGDPPYCYQPPDRHNEALRTIAEDPWFRLDGLGCESHEQLVRRRNNVLRRFPELTMISAHMDNRAHDLDDLAQTLRQHSNLHVELGQQHLVFATQPRMARRFFSEFSDRILFGGDRIQSVDEYQLQFRVLETDDDAFVDPSDPERRPLYGLDLPEEILRRVYFENAVRLIPRLAEMFDTA